MRKLSLFRRTFFFVAGGVFLISSAFAALYLYLPVKIAHSIYDKSGIRRSPVQTPAGFDPAYRDVVFPAGGGVTLSAWWLPVQAPRKPLGTIILTHGAFHNREQVLDRAKFLIAAGYQVLMFDQRGCGRSGPSPLSGGVSESLDFSAAGAYLKTQKALAPPVVYFGYSMGAIGALRAAAKGNGVDAVVADSPLANLRSYVSRRTAGGMFTRFPGFLDRCLSAYDSLSGLSLTEKDLDLVPVVEALRGLPVLYLTGENDDLALPEETRKLFVASDSKHRRLVYIPGAGHEQTYQKYPVIYEKSVLDFLADLRNGFPGDEPVDFESRNPSS